MRISYVVLIAATMATAIFADSPAFADWLTGSGPRFDHGRWCAVMSTGAEGNETDCTIDSIEVCRERVIAGNRGFCTPNPSYVAYSDAPPRRHKRRIPRR